MRTGQHPRHGKEAQIKRPQKTYISTANVNQQTAGVALGAINLKLMWPMLIPEYRDSCKLEGADNDHSDEQDYFQKMTL